MYKNCGLAGYPLTETAYPLIFNYFSTKANLNSGYNVFELKEDVELPIVMHFLERFGFIGLNIASPLKLSIIQHIQKADPTAIFTGAVDIIKMTKDGWTGYNTGKDAFLKVMGDKISPDADIAVIGAGGTARAVIGALIDKGIKKITIINRGQSRVEQVRQHFKNIAINYRPYDVLKETQVFDILINTTPIDWDNQMWRARFWPDHDRMFMGRTPEMVIDLNYNLCKPTTFLAMWNNSIKYDGLAVHVEQVAKSVHLWFDIDVDYDLKQISLFGGK